MYFVGPAVFWLQSLEDSATASSWEELCHIVCKSFDRDQHNQLLRQFFHVKKIGTVSEYFEKFDELVHQILAHDPKFNAANVISRFIDGLREDIRAVVLIHRPENLDTASSLALL